MSFNHGRYPQRPRPLRPHAFVVGEPFGERLIVRITTTRVLLECKCGSINAIPMRRLEKEKPRTCRKCGGGAEKGSAATRQGIVGQRFGTRVVESLDLESGDRGEVYANTRCDCGTTGKALPRHLLGGIAQACPRCADSLRGVPLRARGQKTPQD